MEEPARLLQGFEEALRHRGPDFQGSVQAGDGCVGLTAARLAILDLSPCGRQPMRSADGRHVIVFNGEIYNFQELRDELSAAGVRFQSYGDTEVVLELYRREGAQCVRRLRGMFAFAIWSEEERTCFLARDPLGIKPLYYHYRPENGLLLFASEIRTLLSAGLVAKEINPRALRGYFQSGSVPEPDTLIEGVHCLEAGSWMRWERGRIERQTFWQLGFGTAGDPAAFPPSADAVAETRAALLDSVAKHFVSDVPVGLFLSGGIDSTAVLALAKVNGQDDLRTFSVGFDDHDFDESAVARRSAEHFGARHEILRLDAVDGRGLFDQFMRSLDQPSVDGFNTFTVSRFAHEAGLKVVLSGLGGDELFGGYPSFAQVPRLLRGSRRLGWLGPLRCVGGRWLARAAPKPTWRRLGDFLSQPTDLLHAYRTYRGIFTTLEANALTAAATNDSPMPDSAASRPEADIYPTPADAISALEITGYMRNQLLRDSDVMSMANSLELRVPFVDRALFERVTRIPAGRRLRTGKRLLVEAVPEIPAWVTQAPKRGFRFPFEQWLTDDWMPSGALLARSGVRVRSWYQRWAVFVFEDWWRRIT